MSLIYFVIFTVAIVIEILTTALVSIWFAVGALVAFIVSLFVEDALILFTVFILSSIVSLSVTKPLLKKYFKSEYTSNDGIISKKVKVISYDEETNSAKVKIGDVTWKAYSSSNLLVGDIVVIKKIEGNKLIVEKENE